MARSPKNHEAAAEFGQRLHALNVERDEPTSKDIELWIYDAFHTRVSQESIRKAHRGEVDPTACDLELITGLAAYYDVEVTDLGPHAARRTLTVMTMASAEARAELPPRIHGPQGSVQLSLDDLAA